jgi:two-component system cell cycle response regulator
MAASDRPPAPRRPSEHPKTNGGAVLEPPTKPPPALSAEQDPPGKAPILIVIHTREAPLLGRRFVLDRSPVRIGRGVENHIVLRDASVSPQHAHLEGHDGAWWCVDDGSTDGVYIDDRPTPGRASLAHGTRIGIGSTIFKFLSGSGTEAEYHEEIYRLTVCDGLTQVFRERYLVEALDKEILRARRLERPLALLMIEIDELGAIDRSNGLPNARDHVLREVAGLVRHSVSRDGILARYGDEGFVIVLPDRTLETARAVAESLCQKVANMPFQVGPGELRATVCIGGVERHGADRASADILERASRALHVAKSRGRNQLECGAVDEGPNSGPGA